MKPPKVSRTHREKATGFRTTSSPRLPKEGEGLAYGVENLVGQAQGAAAQAAQVAEEVDLLIEGAIQARQVAQEVLRALRQNELPGPVLEAIRKAAEEAAQQAAWQAAQKAAQEAAWQAAQQTIQTFLASSDSQTNPAT